MEKLVPACGRRFHLSHPCCLLFVSVVWIAASLPAQAPVPPAPQTPIDLVIRMAHAEMDAAKLREHFAYRRAERSTRTRGHLWVENVVETSAGRMHRLVSHDGVPLSSSENKAELDRVHYLAEHPDEFRRENQARKDDEARTTELLSTMPKMFLFEAAGAEQGCTRINFKPNPTYQEQTYQDRIIHAMAGYLLIAPAPGFRLCRLDATLQHQVEFGYGLLGRVSPGSSFLMARMQVLPGQWKTGKLVIHVDGNILLLKSVSRQEDSTHSDFREVPFGLSVQDAASMVDGESAF